METKELISVDDLFVNLANQHAETFEKYVAAKAQLDGYESRPQQQGNSTFSLTEIQELRDQCVKLEGALDGLNLYFTECLGQEAKEWISEKPITQTAKPKVRLPKHREEEFGDLKEWSPDEEAPKVSNSAGTETGL
jgi:hypothetical protein